MTNREQQRRLDILSMAYLTAIDARDFDAIDSLWTQAERDPDLAELLHGLNEELAAERDAAELAMIGDAVISAVEKHMPSAEVIGPEVGPLTVAEVARYLRDQPPRGITSEDLKLNEGLQNSAGVVPADLGITHVRAWGSEFGAASEVYWRAFRATALKLRMRRGLTSQFQMAARHGTKPTGGQS